MLTTVKARVARFGAKLGGKHVLAGIAAAFGVLASRCAVSKPNSILDTQRAPALAVIGTRYCHDESRVAHRFSCQNTRDRKQRAHC